MHLALERSQEETVWLLLWLASTLPTSVFPEEVQYAAQRLHADRATADQGEDVRGFRDGSNRTAEDVAREKGDLWSGLLAEGILTV